MTDASPVKLHPSCVTDRHQPVFDEEWQRRAFGLAVALSEFGHYPWVDFQQELMTKIGAWEDAPTDARGRWEYYEHWVTALGAVVREHGILDDGYVNPEDRDSHP
jgi:nitrile hydratase accessory protein